MTGEFDKIKYGVFLKSPEYDGSVRLTGVSTASLPSLEKQNAFVQRTDTLVQPADNTVTQPIESKPMENSDLNSQVSSPLPTENLSQSDMSMPSVEQNLESSEPTVQPTDLFNTPNADVNATVNENMNNMETSEQVVDATTNVDNNETQNIDNVGSVDSSNKFDLETFKNKINDIYKKFDEDLKQLEDLRVQLENYGKEESINENNNLDQNNMENKNIDEMPKLENPMSGNDPLMNDAMTQIQNMVSTTENTLEQTQVQGETIPSQTENVAVVPSINPSPMPPMQDTQVVQPQPAQPTTDTQMPSVEIPTLESTVPTIDEAPIKATF